MAGIRRIAVSGTVARPPTSRLDEIVRGLRDALPAGLRERRSGITKLRSLHLEADRELLVINDGKLTVGAGETGVALAVPAVVVVVVPWFDDHDGIELEAPGPDRTEDSECIAVQLPCADVRGMGPPPPHGCQFCGKLLREDGNDRDRPAFVLVGKLGSDSDRPGPDALRLRLALDPHWRAGFLNGPCTPQLWGEEAVGELQYRVRRAIAASHDLGLGTRSLSELEMVGDPLPARVADIRSALVLIADQGPTRLPGVLVLLEDAPLDRCDVLGLVNDDVVVGASVSLGDAKAAARADVAQAEYADLVVLDPTADELGDHLGPDVLGRRLATLRPLSRTFELAAAVVRCQTSSSSYSRL